MESASLHALLIEQPGEPVRRVELGAGLTVAGRTPPAELVLAGAEVSRRHCQLVLTGDTVMVTDLGSTNGTFVDGVRVSGSVALLPGALLRIGHFNLAYERRDPPMTALAPSAAFEPEPLLHAALRAGHLLMPASAGDALDYREISPNRFAGYVLEAGGIGVVQALRAAGSLAGDPAAMLTTLNATAAPGFGIWCWAYDAMTRVLEHAGAGHPPVILLAPNRQRAVPLSAPNPGVAAQPGAAFRAARVTVRPGCSLYVFGSNVLQLAGGQDALISVLQMPPQPVEAEAHRVHDHLRSVAAPDRIESGFTMVVLEFP